MNESDKKWWNREGKFVEYSGLQQGIYQHCVYASIAGAVNHLVGQQLWSPIELCEECLQQGLKKPDFGVANIALKRANNLIEKIHHNSSSADEKLSLDLIRRWIDEGSVLILSMEVGDGSGRRQQAWHMFSLVAQSCERFQVWDTNGHRGFFTEHDIFNGCEDPAGRFFMPHDKEDTLVLKLKE